MKLNEITTATAEQLGILPVHSRIQRLSRLKSIIDATPFDQCRAEAAQNDFVFWSADAREGLGPDWDYVVLAITLGFDIPESAISRLAAQCAENIKNAPKLFED